MKTEARKHSKYSASGAERYFQCPGSVALSEGLPDRDNKYSIEGTQAHTVLEALMKSAIEGYTKILPLRDPVTASMISYGTHARDFIMDIHEKAPRSEIMVETRISLPFIHPEMFGTFDSAVVDHFGTLHVFDYKYGAGVPVGPEENLQMIFYGMGVAHQWDWNFKKVRLWIIQPRIKGYDGPLFWEIGILELKKYVDVFRKAVERVERYPNKFVEGSHCHWCKAKSVCPLKQQGKLAKAKAVFQAHP